MSAYTATSLPSSWRSVLTDELDSTYFHDLLAFVTEERKNGPVYPPENLVFNALQLTPFDKVNVVIMGQDPYHGPGQAEGLCFSVKKGVSIPPSLQNIYKELHSDLGISKPAHGSLASWAKQGVLLLNATLTVAEKNPLSHHGKGWERFTDAIIEKLGQKNEAIIFLLWGSNAQKKCKAIAKEHRHHVLTAAHPSPLSAYRGFFGCRHFSKTNALLEAMGKTPIDWRAS